MKLEGLDKSKKIIFKSGNPIYKIPEDFGYEPKDKLIAKSANGKIELISEAQFGFETMLEIADAISKKENHKINQQTHDRRIKKAISPYGKKYSVSEEGTIDLTDFLDKESVEIKSKRTINIK